MGADQPEDDDDAISITSTIEENPDSDNEWPVNRVLAEADVEGEKQYLIEWQGFSLAEATWEPRGNLKDALLADWEQTKIDQKQGLVPKFKIKQWRDAYVGHFRTKLSRHNRRNRKRTRLGLPETTWAFDLKDFLRDLEGLPEDDDDSNKDEDYKDVLPSANRSSSKKLKTHDGSTSSPESAPAPRKQKKPEPRQPGSSIILKRLSSSSKSDGVRELKGNPLKKGSIDKVSRKGSADSTSAKKISSELASSKRGSLDQGSSRRNSADFNSSRKNSFEQNSPRRNSIEHTTSRKPSIDQAAKSKMVPKDTRKVGQSSAGNLSSNNSQDNHSGPLTIVKHPVALFSKRTNPFHHASSLATMNVFAGGHTRKDKPTLRDAASDPTKDPKLFTPHLTRTLELKRRDREGMVAPAQRPPALYSLDQSNPQIILRDSTAPGQAKGSPALGDPMEIESNVMMTETPAHTPTQGVEESVQVADAAASSRRTNKKKRAVHWDDEPMELDPDDSLFLPDQPLMLQQSECKTDSLYAIPNKIDRPLELPKPPPAPRKISLDDYRAAQLNRQAVQKESQLGSDASQIMNLSFSDIPADRDMMWISKFNAESRLIFTHICTAQDFKSQSRIEGALIGKQLCEGTVSSITHSATLDVLTDRLRLGSRGILSHNDNYCVLVFPSGCDDWRPVNLVGSLTPTDHPLRYTIFEPPSSFEEGLFPLPFSDILNQQDGSSSLYSRPFEQMFGPKYEQLLPTTMVDKSIRHSFFLAFPPRAGQEAAMLSRWLRTVHTDCEIRASHFPGHWSSFLGLTYGVVIIHEDVVWAIRLFPNFCRLLHGHTANFRFWVFTRSILPLSTFNSREVISQRPGDLRLQKVFTPGIAILMTPSFFVSQPEQAYNFLKWFWQNYSKSSDLHRKGKLVVCADIEDWAYELALEKAALRKSCPPNMINDELRNMGIQEKALEARFKSWNLLRQLSTASVDETSNSLAFAPDSIDGNDEQSLVNWFGHWSIMNMDQFRKFTVLGSTQVTLKRLTRSIRSPTYKKHIISDPDEVEGAPDCSDQFDVASATLPSASHSHWEDEASHMSTRLHDLRQGITHRKWCPVILYYHPAAYWHAEMPYRYGDLASKFRTYAQWFNFFWDDFSVSVSTRKKIFHNTYAGVFYTVDAKWDPSITLTNPPRRPWVAILRPVNPHIRPWRDMELFIWDITYDDILAERKHIYNDDLQEAHQELINYVDQHLKLLPLKRVWVGGFGAPKSGNDTIVEITLQWLDKFLDKVKSWVPAFVKEIPTRGWCEVEPRSVTMDRETTPLVLDMGADMDIDSPTSDNGEEILKSIFHPPRGHGRQRYSRCRNRLYNRAIEAERVMPGKPFDYTFRPTLEWYQEQHSEGRGFEHVKVMTWEDVFELYKIDNPKKVEH